MNKQTNNPLTAAPPFPPLCSVEGVKARLSHFQAAPNKALGQNFLTDAQALSQMLSAMPPRDRCILEIGPGLGALTEALLQNGAQRVVAVEKDAHMVNVLRETLCMQPEWAEKLVVAEEDIQKIELSVLFGLLQETPFFLYGNLPYYITTPVIMRFLECSLPITGMTLMLQKEAADRFFAKPGDRIYGPLTVLAQLRYTCERGISLAPSAYFPQPEVHSSVVHLTDERPLHKGFSRFIKNAFAMRRKTLPNVLTGAGYQKEDLLQALNSLSIAENARAESLTPETLNALYMELGRKDSSLRSK